ncbi:MAG: DUF4855 domain-containing protein [Muribaculaceae bacterium]|nr:DUF4855 domain-containing protein [Muribaculaceae bacterium]
MNKRCFAFLCLMTGFICALCGPREVNAFGKNESMTDNIAIYYAGNRRLPMTEQQWLPYVAHTFQDGHKEWFFQGFVMEDLGIDGRSFLHQIKKKDVVYATKEDWIKFKDMLFIEGRLFDALDKAIESQKQVLGEPPFRHKVVIGIPMAIKDQKNWGKINGRTMDFSKDSDRITALKWFVKQALDTFRAHHYSNFDLDGFYWIEEDMEQTAGLATEISKYIHQLGYKHYWAPYLTAVGSHLWQDYGFDYAYTQSGGYTIKDQYELSRVVSACQKAKRRGMGMVVEMDEHVIVYPSTYVKRLNECYDTYLLNRVLDDAAMMFYDGAGVFYYLSIGNYRGRVISNQDLKQILPLIDRMAKYVDERRKKFFGSNSPQPKSKPQTTDDWRNPDYWHF